MSDPFGGRRRLPLVLGSGAVVVVAIVAIAIGVNSASAPLPAPPIPFANCATGTFGPVLKPINPPASVHAYSAAPATTIDATKLYQATIATAKGNIVLCL